MDNNKILVVDDEEKIIDIVKSYLEHNDFIVYSAKKGETALNIFNSREVDLIILDLMLPDMSGEDICRKIRKKSDVPIIMLTAKVEEEDILQGLNIGADDYVTKPFSPKQLLARVNAILRRTEINKPLFEQVSFNNDDLTIDFSSHAVKKSGKEIQLTASEFKILSALIRRNNMVFTRDELMTIVFGIDYDGYERTIDSHIKNLRSKIETNTREPEYVLTVHGIGYKFGGERLNE